MSANENEMDKADWTVWSGRILSGLVVTFLLLDGAMKLVPTAMLQRLGTLAVDGTARLPGQRELAMLLTTLGATLLAGLPLLLHFAGSRWNPGPQRFQNPRNSPLPFRDKSNQPAT